MEPWYWKEIRETCPKAYAAVMEALRTSALRRVADRIARRLLKATDDDSAGLVRTMRKCGADLGMTLGWESSEAGIIPPETNEQAIPGFMPAGHMPADSLCASEALYGFLGWLTGRAEQAGPFSSYDDAADAVRLVEQFCKANGLDDPRIGWADRLVHPAKEVA